MIYELMVDHRGRCRCLGFVAHEPEPQDDYAAIVTWFTAAGYFVSVRHHNGPLALPDAHCQCELVVCDHRTMGDVHGSDHRWHETLYGAVWPIDDPRPPRHWHRLGKPGSTGKRRW